MEDLVGRAVAQRLARAVVQPVLDLAHLLRRDLAEIDALREVLANQAVDVLVPATFPRMVRSREVESRVQPLGDPMAFCLRKYTHLRISSSGNSLIVGI